MSMKTYWPLRNPGPNRLPQPDHPARSEPLYAER